MSRNVRDNLEKELLGCLLFGEGPEVVFKEATEDDFKNYENKGIFSAAKKMWGEHGCLSAETLIGELDNRDLVMRYVECMENNSYGDGSNMAYLVARQLRTLEKEFDLQALASEIQFCPNVTSDDVLKMDKIMREISKPRNIRGIEEHLKLCFQRINAGISKEAPAFITGLPHIDKWIVNQGKGKMLVVAARPKMGKSSFVIQCAVNSARSLGKKVCVVAVEMTGEDTTFKILSHMSGITTSDLQLGNLRETPLKLAINAAAELTANNNIEVLESIGSTADEICAAVAMKHEESPFSLVLIDQLQSMKFDDKYRVIDIGRAIDAFINLGKRLGFPVVLACQLRRSVESGRGQKPGLSDLRDSGEIEQKADVVIFFHKEKKWANTRRLCFIAANRFGPTGGTYVYFDGAKSKFTEEARSDGDDESDDPFEDV